MARATPGLLIRRLADGAEERIELRQDVTTFGRSDSCSVVIPLPTVSRVHARITLQQDRYVLSDAGSANGTFVNGERIQQSHRLSSGDEIWLGTSEVTLAFTDLEETLVMQPGDGPAPLFIDEDARTVKAYGVPVQLSPLEYGLLSHLAGNRGTVCTRDSCCLAVWGHPYDRATCEDALNACISKLRRHLRVAAISVGQEPPPITTVQRVGFRLDADVAFASRAARPAPAQEIARAG